MNDRNAGEEMLSELGLDPALEIDTDQRAELLRSWHSEEHEGEGDPPDDGDGRPGRDSSPRVEDLDDAGANFRELGSGAWAGSGRARRNVRFQ